MTPLIGKLTRSTLVTPLLAVFAAGCASSSSPAPPAGGATNPAVTVSQTPVSSVTASSPGVIPSTAYSAGSPTVPASSAAPTVSPSASGGLTGADVYLAQFQDARSANLHEPDCHAACTLAGDGTTALLNMTWSTWNGTEAVGAGTEKLDTCEPSCATGKWYMMKVTITLTDPVKYCAGNRWVWTHALFTWPDGLPSAFSGESAPTNPWDWSGLRAQAAQSCP